MAQVFNRIEMDIRTKIPDIITAVQNDSNSRFLDVFLFDGSTPINLTGHEVRIYCRKPENGGEVFNNGEITEPTNGRCQFPLTDQTLAKVGYVEAQIVIYYQNVQVLKSHPFNINVVESLISSGAVESSNEYGALVVLYQNLYEAYDLMTTMVQAFGLKGQISADRNINTFWQSLEYVSKYLDTDIKNLLDTVLAEANVQGVIDRLGNTTDTGATTIFGRLNAGVVKSVQRGLIITPPSTNRLVTVNINTVNPDKCFVILNDEKHYGAVCRGAYLNTLTATQLTFYGNYGSTVDDRGYNSWQVIEFI